MNIIRMIIIFLALLVVSFLLYLGVYGTVYTTGYAANALFVVGMLVFLPTIIAMTQAYRFFQGFNYAIRSFISTSFRQNYPKFNDYKSEKDVKIKTTIFIESFIASGVVVIIGIILSVVALS